ncbi:MAG TPA: hypothetical protein VFR07_16585 [Mycobacteriales bacterium]|jgi:hypothetical protein|nr:hypothetical protein [Mycobacteriales bacterium]
MRARAAAALLVLLLTGWLAAPARAAEPAPRLEGVLVIGVAGLTWSDVGRGTPHLSRLAEIGAVGVLSVKGLPDVTCRADGWLTLGAGARAQAYGVRHAPCDSATTADPRDAERNAASRDGARLGALAEALGGRVQAAGPGAVLALGGAAPAGAGQPVVLVDGGEVRLRDDGVGVRAADAVVGQALERLPADVDLIVVGLSEGPGEDDAHLHYVAGFGPSFPRGALSSPSTGRSPYVQLIDVAPTVLTLMGVPVPDTMDGQPWQVSGAAPAPAALEDLDDRAFAVKHATVWWFVTVLVLELGLLLLLARSPRRARVVALAGVAVLGASYLANLVPWWRSSVPLFALLAVTLALAAVAAALALRTRHPEGWVCAGVAAVVAGDLVTGAHLQLDSVAGYSSLVAGRFSGIGNVAFGVYAAAALLGTALLAGGRRALLVVPVAGLVAVAADGAPMWGSDVGGVLALVPAFVVLALLLTGTRVSVVRLALAVVAAALVVTAFALADAARPARDRTHLGRFVGQVRDGTAGDVLGRKAEAVFALLFHSPVTALLPLVVGGAVLLVLRPPRPLARALTGVPGLRAGLAALGVASAIGFAVNDSGAAVPALALAVAVPAVVAAVCGVSPDGRAEAGQESR